MAMRVLPIKTELGQQVYIPELEHRYDALHQSGGAHREDCMLFEQSYRIQLTHAQLLLFTWNLTVSLTCSV